METIATPYEKFLEILPYFIPFIILNLILVVVALVDLARREKTFGPKWMWVPIILFVSLFGSIAYLIIGRRE